MSDQEQSSAKQDEEQNEDEDGDEDEDEQEEENQDEDQDEEQDQDEQGQDENQDEEEADQKEEDKAQESQKNEALPKFHSIRQIEPPVQFKFANLLAEISNLSVSVDNFIRTLPSHVCLGSTHYRSSYIPPVYNPPVPRYNTELPKQELPRVIIMKDQDVQVSMQPQIVIQPTIIQRSIEKQPYRISNESNKFLAQLYQQNKKLKRWQNSSHQVNSNFVGAGKSISSGNGFYNSREKYERKQYEKGLFNVEERNKQIDQAIQMLRHSEE